MPRTLATDTLHPRPPWVWAGAGLMAGAALALLLFAPARWLARAVAWATEGHVVMQAARGTVWRGSAQWVLAGGRGSRDAVALPSRLSWQLRPGLTGLHMALHASCCTPQPLGVHLQAGWRRLTITIDDGAPSHWPAALLAGLGTPWNTVQLDGRLQLATRGLVLQWGSQALQMQGQVELLALDMTSSLTTLRPMGSYRLTLKGGPVPTLRLVTLAGGLQVTGSGQWQGTRLQFSGEAHTAPGREAVLAHLLNLIGRREGARSIITLG